MDDKLRKWHVSAAESVCSRCGYGAAKNWELARDVKNFPKQYHRKIYDIAKTLRDRYKRKGVLNVRNK